MSAPRFLLQLLGGLRIGRQGEPPVDFSGHQAGAILAYLALNPKRAHTREELADIFWPDDDPEEARAKLRKSLHSIRARLEQLQIPPDAIVIATRSTLQISQAVSTDVAAFDEAILAAGQSTDARDKAIFLNHAVGLYRGHLLPGAYQDCFITEHDRLSEALQSAFRELTLAYEQLKEYDRALDSARRAVTANPLNEEAHCDLMRLYAAKGQPSAVLRQFQEMERVLAAELGEQPSEEARKLMETLRVSGYSAVTSRATHSVQGAAAPDSETEVQNRPLAAIPVGERSASAAIQLGRVRLPFWRGIVIVSALAFVAAIVTAINAFKHPATPINLTAKAPKPMLGSTDWIFRFQPGPGDKWSEPSAVAATELDNVYVTGMVNTAKHDTDFITMKLDKNGDKLWEARYDGPSHDVDRARCMTVDGDENVFVAGESDSGNDGNKASRLAGVDIAVVKYDRNGHPSSTWPDEGFGMGVRRYNGPRNGEDWPIQLMIVEDGSLYVLGKSWTKGTKNGKGGFGIVLIKYSANGKREWAHHFENGYGDDAPCGMTRDIGGNIYIAGTSRAEPPSGPENDLLILKYSKNGTLVWAKRWGVENHADDGSRSIVSDVTGNLTIVGSGRGLPGTPDANRTGLLVWRFDANGQLVSVRGVTQESDRVELAGARVQAFSDGACLVAGTARVVVRDPAGLPRWIGTPDSPYVAEVATCGSGPTGVFVLGYMCHPAPRNDADALLMKFDHKGKLVWELPYDYAHGNESAAVMSGDRYGRPVAAFKSSDGKAEQITVITYRL